MPKDEAQLYAAHELWVHGCHFFYISWCHSYLNLHAPCFLMFLNIFIYYNIGLVNGVSIYYNICFVDGVLSSMSMCSIAMCPINFLLSLAILEIAMHSILSSYESTNNGVPS